MFPEWCRLLIRYISHEKTAVLIFVNLCIFIASCSSARTWKKRGDRVAAGFIEVGGGLLYQFTLPEKWQSEICIWCSAHISATCALGELPQRTLGSVYSQCSHEEPLLHHRCNIYLISLFHPTLMLKVTVFHSACIVSVLLSSNPPTQCVVMTQAPKVWLHLPPWAAGRRTNDRPFSFFFILRSLCVSQIAQTHMYVLTRTHAGLGCHSKGIVIRIWAVRLTQWHHH